MLQYFPGGGGTACQVRRPSTEGISLLVLDQNCDVRLVSLNVEMERCTENLRSKVVGVLCDICEKISIKRAHNTQHQQQQHTRLNGATIVCPKCSENFDDKFHLSEHKKLCRFSCPAVNCTFTHLRELRVQSHYRKVHKYDHI